MSANAKAPDVLRIVAVWESQAAADAFFAQLPDANRARPGPAGQPVATAFAAERANFFA